MQPSSYILFARKIKGAGLRAFTLRKRFLTEVEKADYCKSDFDGILEHLYSLNRA